jgi:hypothetical protein
MATLTGNGAFFKGSNAVKELVETSGMMINIEFINESAIG